MKNFTKIFLSAFIACSSTISGSVMASTLALPATMDAASVQAKLKELLYNKLQTGGEIVGDFQANLTGTYSSVTLEDQNTQVVCDEFSQGVLAVQLFKCTIEINDGLDQTLTQVDLAQTMDAASVQALVKELLFTELDLNGPITRPFSAQLTGSYSEVTLEDDHSKLLCTEHSAGILAVQTFSCSVSLK